MELMEVNRSWKRGVLVGDEEERNAKLAALNDERKVLRSGFDYELGRKRLVTCRQLGADTDASIQGGHAMPAMRL